MNKEKRKMQEEINKAINIIIAGAPANTGRAIRSKWKRWQQFNQGLITGDESAGDARAYIAGLKAEGMRLATIKHTATILKSIYDKLLDFETVKKNIFKAVAKEIKSGTVGSVRPTQLTPFNKVFEMLEACEYERHAEELQAMLAILYGGGRRIGELVKIKTEDVQRTPQGHLFIKLHQTKNGKDFNAVISDEFSQYVLNLVELRKWNEQEFLFTLSYRSLFRLFKKIATAVGINASPHSGRATAITYLLDQGCDYQMVKEFSGHSSIVMVERYDKRRFENDNSPALKIKYKKE